MHRRQVPPAHRRLTVRPAGEALPAKKRGGAQVTYTRLDAAILPALLQPGQLLYEPSLQGLPIARVAVTGYYSEQGLEMDPGSIFLACGTNEAHAHLCKLLLERSPGPNVPAAHWCHS